MRRREFLSLLGGAVAALAPMSLRAEQSPPAVIGFLQTASAASVAPFVDAFRDTMRQLGYIEGRNIRSEYRFAAWRP
jgi:putative ABC transport system substrate-binding protein